MPNAPFLVAPSGGEFGSAKTQTVQIQQDEILQVIHIPHSTPFH